jgi:uncharacterized protein (DUF1800 family)
MAGFARIAGMDFVATQGLANQLANAGQKLFGAPTPAGLPDDNAFFLGSNAMRQRWQLLIGLAKNSWGNGVLHSGAALQAWGGKAVTPEDAVRDWMRIFGANADDRLVTAAMDGAGLAFFADVRGVDDKLAMAAAIAAMSPAFQVC